MNIEQVRRVLIIGAGTMGQQIGLQCALHGYDVVLYDVAPDALDRAIDGMRGYVAQFVAQGHLPAEAAPAVLARLTPITSPELAAQEVDIVSESVPEDPELKGRVLGQFNTLCPPRTVFTTNTSLLVPSQFAAETGRPGQFAALHFHQPVWSANVVDVMPHPGTEPATMDLLVAFARRIGQIPIVLHKEQNGYVFNTMLSAINREALTLAANDVASVEDIDRAWMGVMKMPVGPFGIMDLVGLDTVYDISDYWARQVTFMPQLRQNADFVKQYVDRGWLGIKAGRGFYTYPNPAYQQPGFVEGETTKG